jgi:DNA-binding MarR family transcriptional regulator
MSRPPKNRPALMAALNAAMREVSGQGVLYSQQVAERLGINSTDLECLDYVMRGPVAAGALAEMTGLTTGAITGVIDRLERAGFVRRESDPDDRRKVLVRALPAIDKKAMPLFAPMAHHTAAQLARYSDGDLDLLLGFLNDMRNAAASAMSDLRTAKRAKSKSAKK